LGKLAGKKGGEKSEYEVKVLRHCLGEDLRVTKKAHHSAGRVQTKRVTVKTGSGISWMGIGKKKNFNTELQNQR